MIAASPPTVLVIDKDATSLQATLDSVSPTRFGEVEFASEIEANAIQRLQQSAGGNMPAVVLIGPSVGQVASLTREMQRLHFSSHVFLPPKAAKLISQLPLSGLHWSTADYRQANFGEELLEAAGQGRQRAAFRKKLQRANQQIRSGRAELSGRKHAASLSDYYLAAFLAHSSDAIIATDQEQHVRYWSEGAARLFELDQDEVLGKHLHALPLGSAELRKALKRIPAQAETLTVESQCRIGNTQLTVESVCSAVWDSAGDFVGLTIVLRDVSERQRKLEEERAERRRATRLIDSERRHLRTLFEQAPGFIAVTTGPEHVFELVNDAYMRIVGPRSVLNKPAREALPEMQGQEFLSRLDEVYASARPHVGHGILVEVQRQAGAPLEQRFVDFVFQPIAEADGRISGIFCQGHDVTEQKLAQQKLAQQQSHLEELVQRRTDELQASQQALHRSQKLEAVGQLTGGVAHDFNNVLQIISGNLQLLEMKLDAADEEIRNFLTIAIEAVDRGSKLSSQLLAFARRQPLRPISVNLGRVLRSMDSLLRRALGEHIEIETVVSGGLWSTMVDPNQLENVVLNLAINARDAMPKGGKLTLELGNALLDEHYLTNQPDVPPGQYVLLAISDTGSGMTSEVMERAFDPFFTTKREGEGTGLGLSMAYGFTKQSGGHIRIYSEPGSGTTFKIYLPRSFEKPVQPPRQLGGPVRGGTETILVVEDDPAVRETAVIILAELNYHVLQADSGESALNVLKSGIHVDLLFTDVVMPGPVSSPTLAKKARDLLPNIQVLFTSGYTQNAIVHGGRLDPGVDLLSKPYRREDLARKVRRILDCAGTGGNETRPTLQPQNILVVEDEPEGRRALAELLTALGHKPEAVGTATEARACLASANGSVQLLITDLNLAGQSGLELAAEARAAHPRLPVIIASGAALPATPALDPPPTILAKPFSLSDLEEAIARATDGN